MTEKPVLLVDCPEEHDFRFGVMTYIAKYFTGNDCESSGRRVHRQLFIFRIVPDACSGMVFETASA
jgi:hypothetical protein